jgi:hypothetical protein
MNYLQIKPINFSVTSSPRFWPFFSQKMPFLPQKGRILSKKHCFFAPLSHLVFPRCPQLVPARRAGAVPAIAVRLTAFSPPA